MTALLCTLGVLAVGAAAALAMHNQRHTRIHDVRKEDQR